MNGEFRKYLVFVIFDYFYPCPQGGMKDVLVSYDTYEEAIDNCVKLRNTLERNGHEINRMEIFDCDARKLEVFYSRK